MATKRISVTVRGLIAPVIGLLSMVVVGLAFLMTTTSLERAHEHLQNINQIEHQIETIQLHASRSNAAFIRTVSFTGAKLEAARVREAEAEFNDAFAAAKKTLGGLDVESVGLTKDIATQAMKYLDAYKSSAQEVIDLLMIDVAMANMQTLDATGKAREMEKNLNALQEKVEAIRVQAESDSTAYTHKVLYGALTLVALLGALSLSIGIVMARNISLPIVRLTSAVGALARGEVDVELPLDQRNDEIGDVIRAVEVFKENAIKQKQMEAEKAAASEARERRAQHIEKLDADFEAMSNEAFALLTQAAQELRATADEMSASAADAGTRAGVVSAASEQATQNVQAVSSATEELSSSIGAISHQVEQSAAVAAQAVSEAEQTNAIVVNLVDATQKIGAVVSLISNIANQTNLLALNATIEAARAGEAGRGFAVVASEVKVLANQTAQATGDISAQVTAMQNAMQSVVAAIEKIGSTIGQMNEISGSVAAAVEEQGAATREITKNVCEAAQGNAEVAHNISSVKDAVDATGASSVHVLNSSEKLSQLTEKLRGSVQTFLAAIKNA